MSYSSNGSPTNAGKRNFVYPHKSFIKDIYLVDHEITKKVLELYNLQLEHGLLSKKELDKVVVLNKDSLQKKM